MSVDTAAEGQRPLSKKKTRRWFLDRTTKTAVVISAGAGTIGAVSALTELANQPTEEQIQAEKAMAGRLLTTYKIIENRAKVRKVPYTEGVNDPPTDFDKLAMNTQVKGIVWRKEENPKDPTQNRIWMAIKYKRGDTDIIGFIVRNSLEEVRETPIYSR